MNKNIVKTDPKKGLTSKEAQERLKIYGKNSLPEEKPDSYLKIFLRQFKNPLIYLLLIAASIIFFVQSYLDALIVSGIVLFNAIIGTIQEGRAQNILLRLKQYIALEVLVVRDGKKDIISAQDLVPGDIMILQQGERISADAQLIEAFDIAVDEAILTGESKPVRKATSLGEKSNNENIVFSGTYIVTGSGRAIVTATGSKTNIGSIGKIIKTIDTEMPLKKEIRFLSYYILIGISAICIFLFLVGLLLGRPFVELISILAALFICTIPEGLPLVLTLTLATQTYRMAKQNVLVKRMQAAEGLARVNTIVLDKTGTLTRNEMTVVQAYTPKNFFIITGEGYKQEGDICIDNNPINPQEYPDLLELGIAGALLTEIELEYIQEQDIFRIKGDPTEAALMIFSKKMGVSTSFLENYVRVLDIPFLAKEKVQAGLFKKDNELVAYMIGAPESIVKRCSNVPQFLEKNLHTLLQEGFRSIGFAKKIYKATSENFTSQQLLQESDWTFLGVVGIHDAIRLEVKATIVRTKKSGIQIIMATGDHRDTAEFIAKQVGIFQEGDLSMEGKEFEILSDQKLEPLLKKITVYARLSPEHKLRLIRLLQKKDILVAMTGDGVNDAPSLIAADLGIAMGLSGTDIAKSAADLILLDDSFISIVRAIEQARHIFYTLRRVVFYFFTTNMAEVIIISCSLLLNWQIPLDAVQILWINLVSDGFLDTALAMEPEEKNLLKDTSFRQKKYLIDTKTWIKILYLSIPMAAGSLFLFFSIFTQYKKSKNYLSYHTGNVSVV